MEVKAISRYVRISPQKVRKIADAIKGKPVETALEILKFMPQKAAAILEKTIQSAAANADQKEALSLLNLMEETLVLFKQSSEFHEGIRFIVQMDHSVMIHANKKQFIQVLGMAKTREVFFTGRNYQGQELLDMGLVDHLVPRSELVETTYRMAEEIAGNAPLSLKGS